MDESQKNNSPASEAPRQQASLRMLGPERQKRLADLRLYTVRDLLFYALVEAARKLAAFARNLIQEPNLAELVKSDFLGKDTAQASSWPVGALAGIDKDAQQTFASMGIKTIGDLAQLAREAGEAILASVENNNFRERPSAPAQLLPGMAGSIASNVRFTTFIRDIELRNLRVVMDKECMVPLPLSKDSDNSGRQSVRILTTKGCNPRVMLTL